MQTFSDNISMLHWRINVNVADDDCRVVGAACSGLEAPIELRTLNRFIRTVIH